MFFGGSLYRDLPHCLGHWSGGLGALEDVTGEPLNRGMFGDEANEAVIARVKCTEGYVLQGVEVVDARLLVLFVLLLGEKRGFIKWLCYDSL